MKKIYTLLTLGFLVFSITVFAQPGSNDPTFNTIDDGSYGDAIFASNSVNTIAIQSDGKIIIGGDFTSYNSTGRNYIARLNADGNLDASFNPGTGANGFVYTIAIQSDGKIIIGGQFTSYNGTAINRIARLNADGSLDASFNPGIGANNAVRSTAIQSDGKIIIGGDFTSYNGTGRNNIARLNADGSLDASLNPGTGANNIVFTTNIQTDGKIIIGGFFTTYNGSATNYITRLNADGSVDASFNLGTGANNVIRSTTIQSDGKIIIGGQFSSYDGTGRNCIARLNADGSLDASFNPGMGSNGVVYAIDIQSDGKIIIGGAFNSYNGTAINRIARLNVDGSLDASLNPGVGPSGSLWTTAIQSDGKIIIGGIFNTYDNMISSYIARLNANGSLDTYFNLANGANSHVTTTAIQSDGKIIIGGFFSTYNGTAINRVARLNADGSLDATFNLGTGANNNVFTTAIQSDGKIIIGGSFTSYDGLSRNYIARLNADGSLDASFNPGAGANAPVRSTTIQSDGKIIIGGQFTSYNGTAINRIARLNADGSIDVSFNTGTGASAAVHATVLQSDGKIIIGGSLTSYNGTVLNRIARLNADGSLDASFNLGTGANQLIWTTVLQSDGKIIINGGFTSYDGVATNYIARLNVNGSLDASFVAGTSAGSFVNTTAIQSDGKIIIGGGFTSYNGTAINRIARLNADGSLDASFNPGMGANSTVSTTAIQSDGKIIIGGAFTSYNGIPRTRIARLLNCFPTTGTDVQTVCNSFTWIDGVTYTSSNNTATHVLTSAAGCDSLVTLNLTITNSSTNTTTTSACDSYIWSENGQTYSASGTYTVVTGCHTEELVLTVTNSTTNTTTETACDSYIWSENGQTYTTSGTYAVVAGCHTEELMLTVTNSTTNTTTETACDSYIWSENGQTYTTSGTYAVVAGCNTEELVLTINTNPPNTVTTTGIMLTADQATAGTTYQWIDCNNGNAPILGANNQSFTASANGNYAVVLTLNGCSTTSACEAINTVDIAEINLLGTIKVYPNPTNGMLNLVFENSLSQAQVCIKNVVGQEVYNQIFDNRQAIELSIEGASGIYFLEITSEGKQAVFKVVKQ